MLESLYLLILELETLMLNFMLEGVHLDLEGKVDGQHKDSSAQPGRILDVKVS